MFMQDFGNKLLSACVYVWVSHVYTVYIGTYLYVYVCIKNVTLETVTTAKGRHKD